MNCNLLQDSNYIATIKTCINLAKLDSINITDKHKCWDDIKCRVRTETIFFFINRNKNLKEYQAELENRLIDLENSVCTEPNVNNLDEYFLVKEELE